MVVHWRGRLLRATIGVMGWGFWLGGGKEYCRAAPEMGKPDFAECLPEAQSEANYTVQVEPLSERGVEFLNNVILTIEGRDGTKLPPITLATSDRGTAKRVTQKALDIGDPGALYLTLKGDQPWQCSKVTVWKDYKYWIFDCPTKLTRESPTGKLTLSGNKEYSITLSSGVDETAGTDGTISVTIVGDNQSTSRKAIKAGLAPGEQSKVAIRAADVGDPTGVILHNSAANNPWYCDFIVIQTDQEIWNFPVKRWVGTPYEANVKVSRTLTLNSDLPAQDIECHTRAVDLFSFIPSSPQTFRVRCPLNCLHSEYALVAGASVHPGASSICKSAIIDGVLSNSGGELVVTVAPELPTYDAYTLPDGFSSRQYSAAPHRPSFSYYVYRLTSIDDIKGDVRVVDAFGKLAAKGRLEIRRDAKWGTVGRQTPQGETNAAAARLACQQLGYLHGELADSCQNVNGQNVCASTGYPSSAGSLRCSGKEKTVTDCVMDTPDAGHDHLLDAAVECTNNPQGKEPLIGTPRIVGPNGSPTRTGVGRLEVYNNGWGSVCSEGWAKNAEQVVCRELGFSAVRDGGISDKSCENYGGVNYCGGDLDRIVATKIGCGGGEMNLRNCTHEMGQDIYCVHTEDVIVACEGDGDASGIGQFKIEEPPKVAERFFRKKVNLNCADSPMLHQETLSGAPGRAYLVSCPEGCGEEPAPLKGTLVYSSDSPICKAAVHAGILPPKGGDAIVILGHPQKSLLGKKIRGVESEDAENVGKTFLVSHAIGSVRAKQSPKKMDPRESAAGDSLAKARFLAKDADERVPAPVFAWTPPPEHQGFRGKPDDFVDTAMLPNAERLTSLNDFTLWVQATVQEGEGTWRTLVTHSECEGFQLGVDSNDELVFEHNCHADMLATGFKPRIGEPFDAVVTYFSATRTVSIFVNGEIALSQTTPHTFVFRRPLVIGRAGDTGHEYFLGAIEHVELFDQVLNPLQIQSLPKRTTDEPHGIQAAKSTRTVDGRPCLTPCEQPRPEMHLFANRRGPTNPAIKLSCADDLEIPPFNGLAEAKFLVSCPSGCTGSGAPVIGCQVYASTSSVCKSALHSGVISSDGGQAVVVMHPGVANYESGRGHHGVVAEADTQPHLRSFTLEAAPLIEQLSCADKGHFALIHGVGVKVLVTCPEHCSRSGAPVIGTTTYSPQSSVCRAALHAGVLSDEGGQVELAVGPAARQFEASEQHGIVSRSGGPYVRSLTFLRGPILAEGV